MKKLISLVLVCLIALGAFSAAFAEEATFEGKIGILYTNVATNEEEYRAALNVQEKYGEDKILIMSQPANKDTDTFISLAQGFAADPEMKAIIICQASSGSIAVCKAIREMRDDILIVCGGMTEELDQISGVMDIGFQMCIRDRPRVSIHITSILRPDASIPRFSLDVQSWLSLR